MATHWYWRHEEVTSGPVSFQELAGLVRDHRINEDDPVRPDYSKEWQTAESVIGLFYMAERVPIARPDPVVATEEATVEEVSAYDEAAIPRTDLEEMLALADQLVESADVELSADFSRSGSQSSGADSAQSTAVGVFPTTPLLDLIGRSVGASRQQKARSAWVVVRGVQSWMIRHQLVSIAAAALIVIGGAWSAYAVGRSADVQRFHELHAVLDSIVEQRRSARPDFTPIQTRIRQIVHDYPDALLKEGASRRNPVKQNLLFVARDILPTMLKADLRTPTIAEKHMASRLTEIGQALGSNPGPL